jgi:hypothetical protein|tara:strand:- start:2437 stop:2601 length:165 start_codon:yes stop_codon:yes gene_type:complete
MADMEMSKSTAKKLKEISELLNIPPIKLIEGLIEEIYEQEIVVPGVNQIIESKK